MIDPTTITRPLAALLDEAFGVSVAPHGFFLDSGQDGLLGTIDQISAQTASTPPALGQETIAAHCGHILYLLHIFEQYERGQQPAIDWPASWTTQVVDDTAWAQLRADLRRSYAIIASLVQAHSQWSEPALAAAMMLLAHGSYHVGVIHKLRTVV
ncbi:MAG: hypothetical protein H7Z42_12210 [Roseiflexaceae bacterium]|nr:hypothetical protein [Roseiflexaceae bacterium]